ncbi:hypothetical protein EVAR_5246_1 [Eumeta japonica]|uniref:Uncharacterized protein n=1 Tax=Eumeta variegata TaxID=151549 RepID=A0A4C1XPM2_EUMVA|nr:hypothetical protein EVAR_5246_1 [Eumeta japonica]
MGRPTKHVAHRSHPCRKPISVALNRSSTLPGSRFEPGFLSNCPDTTWADVSYRMLITSYEEIEMFAHHPSIKRQILTSVCLRETVRPTVHGFFAARRLAETGTRVDTSARTSSQNSDLLDCLPEPLPCYARLFQIFEIPRGIVSGCGVMCDYWERAVLLTFRRHPRANGGPLSEISERDVWVGEGARNYIVR